MKRHHDNARGLLLLTALLACLALAVGCTETPVETPFDNPFDPDGASGGDPFDLVAVYSGNKIVLSWTHVGDGVENYLVLHSLDGAAFADLDTVPAPTHNYFHLDYAPNQVNWYKIRALDALGQGSDISAATPATLLTPPFIEIGDESFAGSRHVTLRFETGVGDRVEVDSLPDFSTAAFADFDEEGAAELAWDLGPAVTPSDWKYLYYRVHTGEIVSPDWRDSIRVRFEPGFALADGEPTVARRRPVLSIETDGVGSMRFAATAAALAEAAWIDPVPEYDGWELTAEADSQWVFAEFSSDFGFTAVDSLVAVPDSLQNLELALAGGAEATSDLEFRVAVDARATQMRIAATPAELAETPWSDYEYPAFWAHDACEGDLLKTVHVQLRNDWFITDAFSGSVTWLPPEALSVEIDAPTTVISGQTVELSGTATAASCDDTLDLVEIDTGDGWETATGLELWTFSWTPPSVEEATQVTLRARVTSGEETREAEKVVNILPAGR